MDDIDFDRLMEIQRMTASSILRESEVDNKIKILDILNNLSMRKGAKIQVEAVILEAGLEGLAESEVLSTIDALKHDSLIIEPEVGYVQLT
ncbi:MAG: hypothetical protein ABIC91_03165 [Nanoarchaeota archaeon]|nr:hypothetical protein [Nanoarchaeota archaeon]MBU1030075.1 hypothetical protein [Nanoarchaeota archaeon]MBU1850652.1 hypothetical protein [Nanoarchaeota archaeon]